MIYSGFAPWGPRDVITANDQSDYLRYFYELYDRVHDGTGVFNYSMLEGTGYDFTTVLTYYLSDPINLIVILFPRNQLLSILNIIYIFKVAGSSLCMSIYLNNTRIQLFKSNKETNNTNSTKKIKKDLIIGGSEKTNKIIDWILYTLNLPVIAFSLLYSLSNYYLGPGFNVATTSAVAIFPLLVLGLEQLIYEKKSRLYLISYTLSFIFNYKIAIISSLFLIIYISIQKYNCLTDYIETLKRKFICDIVCALLSSVIILNNIFSTFWINELTLPEKPSISVGIWDVLKMMTTSCKPSNILISGNNIYIYCGIITLLLVICFLINNNIDIKQRIKYIVFYILLLLGFIVSSLNTIFNGFIYFDGLTSNFAYTFIFIAILISYIEYRLVKNQRTYRIIIGSLISAILIVGTLFLCDSYGSPSIFIKSLEFIMLYSIILIIYSNNSMTKWLTKLCISILIIIEILISYPVNMKDLSWLTYPYHILNTYRLSVAVNETKKEIPSRRLLKISESNSYHTPLEVTLLGYNEIIWSGDNPYKTLEYINEIEGYNIYKSNGKDVYILPEAIINYKYNKYSPIESINDLSANYLKEPITMQPIPYQEAGGNYANYNNFIYISHEDCGDLFYNYSYVSNINDVEPNTITEFTQYVNKNRHRYIKGLYKFTSENYIKNLDSLEGYNIDVMNLSNSEFNITANKSGLMTLGLYNRPGWLILINNKTIKPKSFLKDGMIVPVQQGKNNIKIKYYPIIFYIGVAISLLTLICIIIYNKKTKRANM